MAAPNGARERSKIKVTNVVLWEVRADARFAENTKAECQRITTLKDITLTAHLPMEYIVA